LNASLKLDGTIFVLTLI